MSKWTKFKEFTASAVEAETRKVVPGLRRSDIFKCGVLGSGVGWLLMNYSASGSAMQIYGVSLFVSELLTSIATFQPDK